MPNPIEEATAYLQKLQTDRRAAIEISDQKAEEAKLIAAPGGIPGRDGYLLRRNSGECLRVNV
jgi:hypothetical protein